MSIKHAHWKPKDHGCQWNRWDIHCISQEPPERGHESAVDAARNWAENWARAFAALEKADYDFIDSKLNELWNYSGTSERVKQNLSKRDVFLRELSFYLRYKEVGNPERNLFDAVCDVIEPYVQVTNKLIFALLNKRAYEQKEKLSESLLNLV